jgi:hypothetical protein
MSAARASDRDQGTLPLVLPEGVHIGMPPHVYAEADAIGAEDLRALYWDPPTGWARSEHNPNRRATRRSARRAGRDMAAALRMLVIQGGAAFGAAYAIEPDDGRSDWARTRDEIRDLLRVRHVEIPRGDFSDATLVRLVRRHGLAHRVFDVARKDYEAARRAGRMHLSEDDARRLRFTAHLIREHEFLGPALMGGMGEVAVFWRRAEDPDTLLRSRLDYVHRQRLFSLEVLGPTRGRDPDSAIRYAIDDQDLDIRRRLDPEAWAVMARFVAEGRLHAWTDDGESARVLAADRELLERIVAAGEPEWVWLFVQLPVDEIGQERGAVVAPRWHKAQGAIWDNGGRKIEAALAAYRGFRAGFGLTQPWAVIDEARELADADVRTRVKREMV